MASVPLAHFQQGWEWGELTSEFGGSVVRLGAVDGDSLVGAMSVHVHPIGRAGKSTLYVPRGPAVGTPSLEVLGPLVDAARAVGREVDALGIRLEPNAPACDERWKGTFRALELYPMYPPSQPRSSWLLDIAPDEAALLAGMKSKTRYNIRLAGRKGVEVSEGGPDHLDEFYTLFRETAERDDFFILDRSAYQRMFQLLWDAGMFALLEARYQGELIAAITLVQFGPTCWYLQGASSNRHRNLMAPYLLQWEGISWAKRRGCTEYDFRAVPDLLREDQDMYGVYRFKEGFGGRQFTAMHTYAQPYQPFLFGLWQLFVSGRFGLQQWNRRRHRLPVRQFA